MAVNEHYFDGIWSTLMDMDQDEFNSIHHETVFDSAFDEHGNIVQPKSKIMDKKLKKYPFGVDELVLIDGVYQTKKRK